MGLSINIIVHIFCQRAHHEAQRTTGESHGPELAALRVTNDPAPEQLSERHVARCKLQQAPCDRALRGGVNDLRDTSTGAMAYR